MLLIPFEKKDELIKSNINKSATDVKQNSKKVNKKSKSNLSEKPTKEVLYGWRKLKN